MDNVKKSGMLTDDEYEMLAFRNAQKLLKLDISGPRL